MFFPIPSLISFKTQNVLKSHFLKLLEYNHVRVIGKNIPRQLKGYRFNRLSHF